ncbi:hypothetical protein EDB92DRAFT_1939586 [Lactarius akahatsu]|uniref:NADH dehydrogenase [ubiquinone] 1 beta subcomplex subunit 4 n=1 Tax=Lactarius akahatsu TaxID=416441 RepID=A0AAD4LVR5_9AGAM|nr:hypothetical protein EDB92DRAFT_1939586 [Lactarius akahatsu]KAH9057644.1 hypothetical protein EDB87DRAFT_1685965 [Lactarius vividus]
MAGHGYVNNDPAVDRWNRMREDVYKHFRFTSRASWISLTGLVLVPSALLYFSAQQDLKWKWNGKLKGESLHSRPSQTVNSTEE